MCVNEEVSLATFVVCMCTSVYLYKRNRKNDRWISILFGYFGCMQIIEYMMWVDQECTGLNQLATTIGFWHTVLQPIVSLVVAYYFTNGLIPNWMFLLLGLYIVFSLPKIFEKKVEGVCSKPCNGSDGLAWEYTNTDSPIFVWGLFCLALAAPLLTMKGNGRLFAGIIVGTYIASHFISIHRCPNASTAPNGSWWCLLSVIGSLTGVVVN